MLGAALRLQEELDGVVTVLGAGCDGELTLDEVLGRVAALARAGAWIDTWSMSPSIADDVEGAARASRTEASMLVVRCARGELGEVEIRGGRRTVELGPLGALAFTFDLAASAAELALARAVIEEPGIEAARDALAAMGVRTELDYERSRAREGP